MDARPQAVLQIVHGCTASHQHVRGARPIGLRSVTGSQASVDYWCGGTLLGWCLGPAKGAQRTALFGGLELAAWLVRERWPRRSIPHFQLHFAFGTLAVRRCSGSSARVETPRCATGDEQLWVV